MTLENLVNLRGRLAETYYKVDPNTIQHSVELMNDRRTNKDLRNKWFWTADFPIYRKELGEAVIYIAGRENNLIFQDINEATEQLRRNDNYVLGQEYIDSVVTSAESGKILKINHGHLNLERYDNELSFFEVDTNEYDTTLNQAQRTVAERCYSKGDDFKKNIAMLNEAGIRRTTIYVLGEDYVKNNVDEDGAIARACRLNSFECDSNVIAFCRNVDDPFSSLRGVLLEVRKADDVKKSNVDTLTEAYNTLLREPIKKSAQMMTPEHAQRMSKILTAYLGRSEQ